MNTKLTLTIDKRVIEEAKIYAKEQGKSLSDIIEQYLKLIIKEETPMIKDSAPISYSIRGAFKSGDNTEYTDMLTKSLSEKYKKND